MSEAKQRRSRSVQPGLASVVFFSKRDARFPPASKDSIDLEFRICMIEWWT